MNQREFWLSGPIEGITPWLQPVAHALSQSEREVKSALQDFPDSMLWEKPADMAAVGFHLQHLTGVLDRLFTYARGETLSSAQLANLSAEGKPDGLSSKQLVDIFSKKVNESLDQLRQINEQDLLQPRGVGRAQLPSNVLGLLFHSAEHCMRHTGQLLVTAAVVKKT
jgi:uncharacterized damage-inducible protein DinB